MVAPIIEKMVENSLSYLGMYVDSIVRRVDQMEKSQVKQLEVEKLLRKITRVTNWIETLRL